jgi:hypothetical protein
VRRTTRSWPCRPKTRTSATAPQSMTSTPSEQTADDISFVAAADDGEPTHVVSLDRTYVNISLTYSLHILRACVCFRIFFCQLYFLCVFVSVVLGACCVCSRADSRS